MTKQETLAKVYADMEAAVSQLPLANEATDIIPGEGSAEADVMLIGEAPGYYESVQRRPFVGRSGQLLRQTLTEVGLPPEKVYISNIVKARPPENRDPLPAEILAYKPYLDREIEIIDPALIVTLGRFSMAKFLPDVKISQVHGRLHKAKWNTRSIFILPMYHPAAALRGTQIKESFVNDFQKIEPALKWIKGQQQDLEFEGVIKDALF